MTADVPLGRGRELTQVDRLLDELESGLRSLTLVGPAGIGKTTVWRAGVDRAADRGCTVLTAQPAEAERALTATALCDLLTDLPPESYEALPPAQRRAFDVGVLHSDAASSSVPPQVLFAACLSALRSLAASRPVLLAVDDAQWLDAATVEVLSFCLRRLERSPIGVLVSVRLDPDRPSTFDTTIAIERRREVLLGPLSIAVLQAIIKRETNQQLSRPTLVRIATACHGNPFYAVEIARELDRVGLPSPGEPLPVPSGLQGLVRSRMSRLPARTRETLLVAACASQRVGLVLDLDSLGPAEDAGIIRVTSDHRVQFTHPLLASAVVATSTAARRRAVHRQLAEQVDDPEMRALHLAAAATGPDEQVAEALDAAAASAADRATGSSADLVRQAIQLTPPPDHEQFCRRVIAFARYARLTNRDLPDLKELLATALERCPTSGLRAELLLASVGLAWNDSDTETGYPLALEAIAITDQPVVAARAHFAVAWSDEDDVPRGLEHIEAIFELIREDDDPLLFADALMHRAYLRLLAGEGADDESIERGKAIQARIARQGWWDRSPVPVIWPLLKDQLGVAHAVHLEHLQWARQVGDSGLEQSMLSFLCRIELLRGNLAESRRWSEEFADLAQYNDVEVWRRVGLVDRATLDAHAGHLEEAAEMAVEALSMAQQAGKVRAAEVDPRELLGFVALCRGDNAAAVEQLSAAAAILDALGQREPARWRFHSNLVDALVGSGDIEGAERVVASLERRAASFPRPWTLAVCARGRGQVLAQTGDLDGAASAIETSLWHHMDLEMPFERGRTLLVKGTVKRRQNERREARAALEDAIALFDRAGSTAWAVRARDELRRIPVRRRREGLTETEHVVATLAAEGLTTKQIADRAFLSPKTVEGNLTRIYQKLGVHSRVELARAMDDRRASSA